MQIMLAAQSVVTMDRYMGQLQTRIANTSAPKIKKSIADSKPCSQVQVLRVGKIFAVRLSSGIQTLKPRRFDLILHFYCIRFNI